MRNFIFKQIFLLSLTFFYAFSIKAQTATGGCSTVTLTSVPAYPTDLIVSASWSCSFCSNQCFDIANSFTYAQSRSWLEQKQANGDWLLVQGGANGIHGDNVTFSVTTAGFYRIVNQRPILLTTGACSSGRNVENTLRQIVGRRGTFQFPGSSAVTFSNQVYAGATQPNDIQFTFVDNNSNSNNLAWDANEAKVINTSGTKAGTYDRYWLAISEQSSPNRWKSQGWTFAQMPTTIDIEQIWKQSFPGGFNSLGSYYVQLAAMNGCNTSGWVEANNSQGSRTFFVCPPGSGCREMGKEETIVISPNPTSSSFRLMGMDETSDYSLTLTDISGRTLKTYVNVSNQDLDVADLPTGMYLAQLWNGAKKVQTSKLSIVK